MSDTRVLSYDPLPTPIELRQELPLSEDLASTVAQHRDTVRNALWGQDPRKLCIVGPCSVHDVSAVLEYATRLKQLSDEVNDRLILVIRLYFQKPRTRVGWTGLLDDPDIDGSFRVAEGIRRARKLMLDVARIGLPIATELLGTTLEPQYLNDLVSFGCIGARTCESQIHRHLASGVSFPMGFKNTSSGDVRKAVDACVCASHPRVFLGIDENGSPAVVKTAGNRDTCVVLRGSYDNGPNDDLSRNVLGKLRDESMCPAVIVDCAHGNSMKTVQGQKDVFGRIDWSSVRGVMLESFLKEGRQNEPEERGVSITDPCLGFADTANLLRELLLRD